MCVCVCVCVFSLEAKFILLEWFNNDRGALVSVVVFKEENEIKLTGVALRLGLVRKRYSRRLHKDNHNARAANHDFISTECLLPKL